MAEMINGMPIEKYKEYAEKMSDIATIATFDYLRIIDEYGLDRDKELLHTHMTSLSQCSRKSFKDVNLEDCRAIGYNRLLELAQSMHCWIFAHVADELEVYDELGMTAKENALLGYGGSFTIKDKEEE